MSWLVVATVPVLLMLATIGLERIEIGVERATTAPASTTPKPLTRGSVTAGGQPRLPINPVNPPFHRAWQPDHV